MDGFFGHAQILIAIQRVAAHKERKLLPVLLDLNPAVTRFAVINQFAFRRRQR